MKKLNVLTTFFLLTAAALFFSQCTGGESSQKQQFGGYDSQVQWGEHLVTVGVCGDCHTPKKMTPQGPVDDSSLLLSGHPAQLALPDIDRSLAESKGLAVTQTNTAWVGPWGVSFAANLTSDATGIGGWQEEQFIKALREGLFKGLAGSRPLLPPMPWPRYKNFTDDELKAIFAYLKSTKPVENVVPAALPPVSVPLEGNK